MESENRGGKHKIRIERIFVMTQALEAGVRRGAHTTKGTMYEGSLVERSTSASNSELTQSVILWCQERT